MQGRSMESLYKLFLFTEKKEIGVYRSTMEVYEYKRRSESCEIVEIQSCV